MIDRSEMITRTKCYDCWLSKKGEPPFALSGECGWCGIENVQRGVTVWGDDTSIDMSIVSVVLGLWAFLRWATNLEVELDAYEDGIKDGYTMCLVGKGAKRYLVR